MNILFANNYFYIRGGSERVFHDEIRVLEKHGHQIAPFCRKHPSDPVCGMSNFFPENIQTDKISLNSVGLKVARDIFYSTEAKRRLASLLEKWPVDIAHAHNIYGRLTSSVLDELYSRNIPVVLTLHDYKLICPSYKLENRGKTCEDCRGFKFYHAIKNRCHKGSLITSGIYAAESYFNHFRKSYREKVAKLISPSQFLRDKFIEFGWDAEHIEVVPNFLDSTQFEPQYQKGGYFLYLGRLSTEKGVPTLIKAFSALTQDVRLVVAGTGPLEEGLKKEFGNHPSVSFTGHISGQELIETIRGALAVVIPSEWYENAPMSVLEAMAFGKPVVGARIGGIPEMVSEGERGFLFEPGNEKELEGKLAHLASLSDREVETLGRNARAFVEQNHSAEMHYQKLMAVYQMALKGQ